MIPVDQTAFGDPHGNCWGAAIASILEVSLRDLPDYVTEAIAGRDWDGAMQAYLVTHHSSFLYRLHDVSLLGGRIEPFGHYLMSGMSPRGLPHSVVGWNGRMVHDPHPSRAGIGPAWDYEFIIPLASVVNLEPERRDPYREWLGRRECICPSCIGNSVS